MHTLSNFDDAAIYADRIESGDIVSLSETIVTATARLTPSNYFEASILHEGQPRDWVIRVTSVDTDCPAITLPKAARPLDVVGHESGHTLISAVPRDIYGSDADSSTKTVVPLVSGLRGDIDVEDDATILTASH